MKTSPATTLPWPSIEQMLRRRVASARAAKGWTWEQLSKELALRGWVITASNLMTRHSRMAFRADELVLILTTLGVKELSLETGAP